MQDALGAYLACNGTAFIYIYIYIIIQYFVSSLSSVHYCFKLLYTVECAVGDADLTTLDNQTKLQLLWPRL